MNGQMELLFTHEEITFQLICQLENITQICFIVDESKRNVLIKGNETDGTQIHQMRCLLSPTTGGNKFSTQLKISDIALKMLHLLEEISPKQRLNVEAFRQNDSFIIFLGFTSEQFHWMKDEYKPPTPKRMSLTFGERKGESDIKGQLLSKNIYLS